MPATNRLRRVPQSQIFPIKSSRFCCSARVRYWHKADIRGTAIFCPLLDKSGHWLSTVMDDVVTSAALAETTGKKLRGELVEASAVEAEWAGVLRTVRAGMLAVPSRVAQRLPHLNAHDISEIDLEVRDALYTIGSGE
jgi:hypothetical protein